MDKLSVVIITLNEECNMRRCLKAASVVADEIVVVDSHSTDATVSICEEYHARVISHTWLGYAEQKNFANQQATYDWILSIDADEELDSVLQNSILVAKKKGFTGAYSMNRLTQYCGHPIYHAGWYPDTKVRLWNRQQGHWEGFIHEKIAFTDAIGIHHFDGNINHYTYHSITEHIKQADKFTTMTAKAAFERGVKPQRTFMIYIKSAWKFMRDYFFRLGFLDGYYGFVICRISAFATFLKYIKLNELHNQQKNATLPSHH